ncbi:MAG: pyridoxine 5'-phosphate synthase [Alphaproteobacteria bacterium]|nr:pyridoxine 5'-phosphate synthase [Alphaproteobacteria bacterium]NCQ88538.1 pyridoxine 5'-phosphate synthase [Alphaproteobacteria bacterium]NCT06081.1 pyridoxine 5'-phosphate synthase [Alphaproteobacteria bacterium]
MTKLSVNLNKVALLRNQRDVGYPNIIKTAEIILNAGAAGITVHPRPDERHIRRSDIPELAQFIENHDNSEIEFNIEGYPADDFIELVLKHKCHQVTLVPDEPNQRTSDHGWDVKKHHDMLKDITKTLQSQNRRVSLFLDPVPKLIEAVISIGAKRIELYTGPYAEHQIDLMDYATTALEAKKNGIEVNAGHDLSLDNLGDFIESIPDCAEVSIGHAITSDALLMGWDKAVKAYLEVIQKAQKKSGTV